MMSMNDDQSEVVDWGDGDDVSEETAESVTAGVDADAVSLASDDDGLEALKKYHQHAWDDSREPPASDQASQDRVELAPPIAQETQESKDSSVYYSEKEIAPNPHGLPPKPSSDVYKGPVSIPVSISATSMAQRDARVNGNHNSPDANRRILPPGWEVRHSHAGEEYYYHDAAGKTQWEFPNAQTHSTRSTGPHERNQKVESTVGRATRRSRSRERRIQRRSLSPPRGSYRPRSRSLERDISYRSSRHLSPKRESSRVPRELNAARIRSRPSSRERRPSPKPPRATARRSRSPARVREGRDNSRQDSRQESSQHQSSRHRSPIVRARSQERDSYRPSHVSKPPMDIDRREPTVHGTVRRRRSWGSPDPSDSKRRRVAASPPPPRGVDRYVPERSSRMDIDPPTSRQETKRPNIPDTYERPREIQQSIPQPPPRERRDRPAGDREHNHASTSQGQRNLPPQHLKTTEPPGTAQRSRAPLPSQAEAMWYGNVKKPRHVPMDVDVNENAKGPNVEQAPTGPKIGRPRGRGQSKSPAARPHEDGGTRSKDGPPAASSSYDQPPKVDRHLHREVAVSPELRNGMPSRSHLPSDPFNAGQRGRGSRPTGPFSTTNLTPLANPKVFGRLSDIGGREEMVGGNSDREMPAKSEQSPTDPVARHETKQNNEQPQKRPRASRFGPPTKIELRSDDVETFESKQIPATLESSHPARDEMGDLQKKDEPHTLVNDAGASKVETIQRPRETIEGLQRDLPPHVLNPEQDVRRAQPRREDGLRIDRNRTSNAEGSDRSTKAIDSRAKTAGPATNEARVSHADVVDTMGGEPRTGRKAVEARTSGPSDGGRELQQSRSPTLSPAMEGSKPATVRQSSLLERLAPVPRSANDNEGEGVSMDADEGGGTDRARKPRGKRLNRGGRR